MLPISLLLWCCLGNRFVIVISLPGVWSFTLCKTITPTPPTPREGHNYYLVIYYFGSLVPRPLPNFFSQSWRKIGRRPGVKTTSRTGSSGLSQYVMWTWFVLTESTISGPWCSFDPRPSPDFSPQLQDKIWEGSGDEATILGYSKLVNRLTQHF